MVINYPTPILLQSLQTLLRPWYLDSLRTLIKVNKPFITKLFSLAHLISTKS